MISETPQHSQSWRQVPLPSRVLAELRLLSLSAPHTLLSPWEDLKKWPHFLMHKATCSEIISPTTRQAHLSFKWNNPIILQQMRTTNHALSPQRFQSHAFGLVFATGSRIWKELHLEAVFYSKANWNCCIPSSLTSDFHQLEEHFRVETIMSCRMFYL